MKVLVVDDDKVATLALEYPLKKLGYEVDIALQGAIAWDLIQKEHYRLVISDWMMPGLDGIELCKRIRQLDQPNYTYIILVTSKDSREDLLKALDSGADDLLTKPLDTGQLYARIGVCNRILSMEDTLNQNAEDLKKSAYRLKSLNSLLEQSSIRFRSLFDGIPIACLTVDKEGHIIEWNQACEKLYGWSSTEVIGKVAWNLITQGYHQKNLQANIEKLFFGNEIETQERIDFNIGGKELNILTEMIPFKEGKETTGAIIANIDITHRKAIEQKLKGEMVKTKKYSLQLEMNEQELRRQKTILENQNIVLSNLAVTDGLTGLMNHRYFRERLEQAIEDVKMVQQPLSVVLLDIDHFKMFNDTYGHPVGDEILKEISSILKDHVLEPAVPARYGGEEFILLLPYCNEVKAVEFSEIIREAVEQNKWKLAPVTISIGIATLQGGNLDSSYIIDMADKALYWSKANGRNRVFHIKDLPLSTA